MLYLDCLVSFYSARVRAKLSPPLPSMKGRTGFSGNVHAQEENILYIKPGNLVAEGSHDGIRPCDHRVVLVMTLCDRARNVAAKRLDRRLKGHVVVNK